MDCFLKRLMASMDYWINIYGVMYNDKIDRLLKQSVDRNGYLRVHLHKDKKCYDKNIHRLLAEAFIRTSRRL